MNTAAIKALIANPQALFAINHSGGKDSQAMMIRMLAMGIPARQLVIVHADLSEVEWKGTQEHARQQAEAAGISFIVARARFADGRDQSFYDMVRNRKAKNDAKGKKASAFPTKGCRECTSSLKRDPINRELRRYANANGFTTIVSCEGIRAAESDDRAKAVPFEVNDRLATKSRAGFTWLPIFDLSTEQVFATIADAGQQPHWAYGAGNERLSCVFCIMASKGDIVRGARFNPEIFARMSALETEVDGQLHISRKTLVEIVAEAERLAA